MDITMSVGRQDHSDIMFIGNAAPFEIQHFP